MSVVPPILAVVGPSGSGKTFLLEKLIPALRERGLRVAAMKHHGHASPFDLAGKDTNRLTGAGAEVVVGVSPVEVVTFARREVPHWMAQVDGALAGADVVLAEGFSGEPFPKIEVRRQGVQATRSDPIEGLLAIVSDHHSPGDVPSFAPSEVIALASFIEDWLTEAAAGRVGGTEGVAT